VVLLPLVAFDMHGWRLGFGAGFYDRKLSFLRRKFCRKPLLIGVGYEFQRVPPQTPGAWDVLLDAVVTERGFQRCRPLHTP
jgi:5-formyltetrahydrofolate cyclo-ligase